jgi:XTP/dITP diphosphohydrolase
MAIVPSMQKLLIATSNAGKVGQYKEYLKNLNIELVSLKDVGLGSIEETGTTFEENALLKARTYFKQSGLPCIADDGGLEIDYFGGKPGVYSRRWKTGDENVTDQELIDYTIEQMKGVPEEKRSARFRMVLAFVDREGNEHTAEASTEGYIPEVASTVMQPGLQFDAVLFIPQFNKIRSELSAEEHDKVNQRAIAIQRLKPIIAAAMA